MTASPSAKRYCPKCDTIGTDDLCPKCWDQGQSIPMLLSSRVDASAVAVRPPHHPTLAPSSLYRRKNCPGSARMEKGIPDVQSDDADEGTELHGAISKLLKAGKFDIVSVEFPDLTMEQAETIQKTLDFVKAQLAMEQYHLPESEVSITVYDSELNELTYGTIDIVAISRDGETAWCSDWKFGRIEVESADENLQLATYALGIAQKYGVKRVECHIFQPRVFNGHSEYVFTDFAALLATIESIQSACAESNAPLCAGDWCKYCRAKTSCPETMAALVKIENVRTDLKVEHIHDITDPNVLCELWARAKIAKDICKSIEHRCKEYARNNNGRCGNLVEKPGRKTRKLSDISAAFEKLNGLIDSSDFIKACDASIPDLEDVLAVKQGIKKAEAKRLLESTLDDTLIVTQGEPTLVEDKAA